MLFYRVIEGSIEDPENMVILCENLYLKDIGTPGYTEWENDESVLEIYSKHPELMKCRSGLIHSHNNMKAFFSGDDWEELEDNSVGVDYYLSLIVNNRAYTEWVAKIAIQGKEEVRTKVSFIGALQALFGKEEVVERGTLAAYSLDIDVAVSDELGDIVENTNKVVKKKEEAKKPKQVIGFKPKQDTTYFSDVDVEENDDEYPSIFMGQAGVVNTLQECVVKMASHLKEDEFEAFAQQKVENYLEVLQELYPDEVTPEFAYEVAGDFLKELEQISYYFPSYSVQRNLVSAVSRAFENATFNQMEIDF